MVGELASLLKWRRERTVGTIVAIVNIKRSASIFAGQLHSRDVFCRLFLVSPKVGMSWVSAPKIDDLVH